jgi:hypothetical protein
VHPTKGCCALHGRTVVAFHKALQVAITLADQVGFRNQILATGVLLTKLFR